MSIHWFPGHMATARDEIRRALPAVDLVIEVLDARIPFSSESPMVADLRGEKPCIQILNKSDLADPAVTAAWLSRMARAPRVRAVPHHRRQTNLLRTVIGLARSLVPSATSKPIVAMILGIPNVGKSTLINTLAGRATTKTGNKPAITQMLQRVAIGTDLALVDTPGLLWSRISPEVCAYRLAVTGAISERVLDYEDLAAFAVRLLRDRYPAALPTFYGLDAVPADELALIEAIGRKRGFLGKGGAVDTHRAAERLILDLREGCFGPISLERPSDCDPPEA